MFDVFCVLYPITENIYFLKSNLISHIIYRVLDLVTILEGAKHYLTLSSVSSYKRPFSPSLSYSLLPHSLGNGGFCGGDAASHESRNEVEGRHQLRSR